MIVDFKLQCGCVLYSRPYVDFITGTLKFHFLTEIDESEKNYLSTDHFCDEQLVVHYKKYFFDKRL